MVTDLRVRAANESPVNDQGNFVLYWMTAFRRLRWNFSLDRALGWCERLGKPLVVLEALRIGYPWASERLHAFVLQGMRDNRRLAESSNALYYPYLEPSEGEGRGLLSSLAEHAAVVVTDDFPCFFLPRMVEAAASRLRLRLEAVDSNGLLPLRATDRVFKRAVDFRRYLQAELPEHLDQLPTPDALEAQSLPPLDLPSLRQVVERWSPLTEEQLADPIELLDRLDIDHSVTAAGIEGGFIAAEKRWRRFLDGDLDSYGDGRNDPDTDTSSGLSAYLHFGHLASHQMLVEIAERESWTPDKVGDRAQGQRRGWWGMSAGAEAYLDQLVTWRELGYNMTSHVDGYDRFDSLPQWARQTIDDHRDDERPWTYTLEQLENAETHDQIWNAAQRQLVREGRIHNYLRMLWGKKIYEWCQIPEEALEIMIHLNNKYALDGRNPNSYSGIFWCLGRYDRAWGPERPIFGKIRFMSSDNTARKLELGKYLEVNGARRSAAAQSELFASD